VLIAAVHGRSTINILWLCGIGVFVMNPFSSTNFVMMVPSMWTFRSFLSAFRRAKSRVETGDRIVAVAVAVRRVGSSALAGCAAGTRPPSITAITTNGRQFMARDCVRFLPSCSLKRLATRQRTAIAGFPMDQLSRSRVHYQL
jgi:hypothetical protein